MKFAAALILGACLGGAPLAAEAAKASRTDLMRQYVYLKDDGDLFVGEGVAELKDHGGSLPKALEAARVRAKGALAEAVRARISSSTVEQVSAKDGAVSESISSTASSQADVSLENIKLKELADFPEEGQVTVLASVAKEDYRRQLAGKAVKVYRLESGLRIGGGLRQSLELGKLTRNGNNEAGDALTAVNLDFLWRNSFAGLQVGYLPMPEGRTPSAGGSLGKAISYYGLRAGYDWAPWAWRVQPFVPLQLGYGYWDMDPYFAQTFDAAAGLGLRYWANDSIAFQLHGIYHQNLFGGEIATRDGKAFRMSADPTAAVLVSGSGVDFGAAIIWSGF